MATGVNGNERKSSDSLTATLPHRDPHPLPGVDAQVIIQYADKLAEREITSRQKVELHSIDENAIITEGVSAGANMVMLADNYFGLHALRNANLKPVLIYLDPPFCTGMDFQSRKQQHAYKDKFGEAAYLEFMRRRLILMREILANEGSIYLHIGHQMIGHLKALMDEVFGPKNFRNIITRRKCSSKNFTSKQYSNIHDYILFYTKSQNYKWNQPGHKPDVAWIDKEYPKIDGKGRYKLVPVHAPGTRRGETGKPWRGRMPPVGKHWQYQPVKLDELDRLGEIHWSKNGNPRRKVYLTPDKTVGITDYWEKYRDAHHQSIRVTGYPTEKNLEMLRMIVGASTDPGDLVVDPFCGSGTTLDAANRESRLWIGIDESFEAIGATLNRLKHGRQQMGDYVSLRNKRVTAQASLFDISENETSNILASEVPQASFQFVADAELFDHFAPEIRELAKTKSAI